MKRKHPQTTQLHPAAIIFRDHLLSGIAEENERIKASIDRLSPIYELDMRFDRPDRNQFDDEKARFDVVGALDGSYSQTNLAWKNVGLKTELFVLEKAAEKLGSVQITNGSGGKATLSLRDGHFAEFYGYSKWMLTENLDISFTDLGSIGCVVSGVPLHRFEYPTERRVDVMTDTGFMKKFRGATLTGSTVDDGGKPMQGTVVEFALWYGAIENQLRVLGIYNGEGEA